MTKRKMIPLVKKTNGAKKKDTGVGKIKINEAKDKPKYGRGDEVYSYANKDYKAKIATVRPSTEEGFNHAYQVILSNGQRSKWIDEPSLSDEPITEAMIKENLSDELENYLSGEGIHGYTDAIQSIVSGDTIPDNAISDIIEYFKENGIDENVTEDEVVEKYSIPQLLEAYLGWNGISGYDEDILNIAGIDYEPDSMFESKMNKMEKLPLMESSNAEIRQLLKDVKETFKDEEMYSVIGADEESIEIMMDLEGDGDPMAKVTIYVNDGVYGGVQNINSDMLDTDHETMESTNLKDITDWADEFLSNAEAE